VVVLLGCVILAELGARYVLGLGNPPLTITDSETEYRFAPSRSYSRFGNAVSFNSYSMRSDEFPVSKEDPDELRVLVIGDSIVYGGALLDQEEIATERLQGMLEDTLDRPVRVANISAGTWGPENFLAYVEKFSLFDADFVFVVVNGEDSHDVTTFEPLERHKRLITRTPTLALEEGVLVYLPRYLPFFFPKPPRSVRDESPEVHARTTGALRSLLEQAKASGATTTLVLHPKRGQALGNPAAGLDLLAAVAGEAGVGLIDLREAYRFQIEEAGREVHQGDHLHLNAHGQGILAESIRPVIGVAPEPGDPEIEVNVTAP
jgi:hypothetical protein